MSSFPRPVVNIDAGGPNFRSFQEREPFHIVAVDESIIIICIWIYYYKWGRAKSKALPRLMTQDPQSDDYYSTDD